MNVHFSSAKDDWQTPPEIIGLVRKMFTTIDLDPAANATNNVGAKRYFTPADDGLAQDWDAYNLFLNPPYGRNVTGLWVDKLIAEFEAKRFVSALALLPARTDTRWAQALIERFPICFVRGRIRFVGADSGAPFPSMIVHVGYCIYSFRKTFSPIGTVKA